MGTRRGLFLVVLTAAVLVAGPATSIVRAEGPPLRSGTIVGGGGLEFAGGQPWEQHAAERAGCEYALDCRAWLQSGCNPALAGHDPVLTASIVDVRDLADGHTRRSLQMNAPYIPPWGVYPGVVIQFWRQDCTHVDGAKLHTIGEQSQSICQWNGGPHRSECQFVIPADARWMTLSGYATTAHLSWALS